MISISLFASGSGSNVEEIFNYFKGHPKIKVDSLFVIMIMPMLLREQKA